MRMIHSIHIGSKRTVATLGAALAALALFGLLTVAGSAGAQSQQSADTPTPAPTHTPLPDLGGAQASKPQGTLDSMLSPTCGKRGARLYDHAQRGVRCAAAS